MTEDRAAAEVPRLASSDEAEAVSALVREAYAPWVARIGRAPAPMSDDHAALIAAGRVHVIGDRGALLAVLVLVPEGRTMLIHHVAIRPARQGRGHGRRMLAFAEQVAGDAGCNEIRLYANAAMTENIGLYRSIGYVETGRAEQDGFDRVFMAKALV